MMINLLKKPLNGGTPAIAIEAASEVPAVTGILLPSPPISLSCRVLVLYSTAPAVRNKRDLNTA